MNLQQQATTLTELHPWQKFQWGTSEADFDTWAFRYLVGCIVVGGSAEASVLAMAPTLFERYPTMEALANANWKPIADFLDEFEIQYSGNKAKNVIETARILLSQFDGKVPNTREQLEQLPGVGRHVASVMLATVFGQEEFAVDLHVRRIMKRWGFKGTDLALEKLVRKSVSPSLYGHFSRSFVDFGQTRCGFTPHCDGCPIQCEGRQERQERAPKAVTKEANFDGYRIEQVAGGWEFQAPGSDKTCTVKHNRTCNCTGFRYRKTCKHVEHVFA